ncbi:MAG: PHP domain-containing protein [Halobacteriota archaeon]
MIFDPHIHSKYSGDSAIEPAIVLKVAKKMGLNGIAVTDHMTIKGGVETRKMNVDPDFYVIVGSEVETNNKEDLVGLFLTEEIKSRNTEDVITEIKAQGGVVFWAHPFRLGKNLLQSDATEQLDLLEGFNSKTSASRNALAQQLARKYDKPVLGASDAHQAFEIGNGTTFVQETGFDSTREALISGKTRIANSCLSYDYLDDML